MADRLYAQDWDDSNTNERERALKMATIELDRMNWKGDLTSTAQALRWPRANVTGLDDNTFPSDEIPTFLTQATVELANSLIQKDRYKELDSTGIRKVSAGEVAVSFDRRDTNPRNPVTVMQMIAPYVNAGTLGSWTYLERA